MILQWCICWRYSKDQLITSIGLFSEWRMERSSIIFANERNIMNCHHGLFSLWPGMYICCGSQTIFRKFSNNSVIPHPTTTISFVNINRQVKGRFEMWSCVFCGGTTEDWCTCFFYYVCTKRKKRKIRWWGFCWIFLIIIIGFMRSRQRLPI